MLIEQRVCDGNEEEVLAFLENYKYETDIISGDQSVMYDIYCKC